MLDLKSSFIMNILITIKNFLGQDSNTVINLCMQTLIINSNINYYTNISSEHSIFCGDFDLLGGD